MRGGWWTDAAATREVLQYHVGRCRAAPYQRRTPRSSDRGVISLARSERSRGVPHTPSLELSVLPNGGGQCIELLACHSAMTAPTNSRNEMELRGLEPLTSAM